MPRSLVAAAATGLLLALTGCTGGDPEPRFTAPEPTTATSSSPAPPPTPPAATGSPNRPVPQLPVAARQGTASGSKAFVDYFWEVADYAQAVGDLDPMSELTSPGCVACQDAIDFVAGIYQRGGTISGGQNSVGPKRVELFEASSGKAFRVTFPLTNSKQTIDEPGSRNDRELDASTVTLRFVTLFDENSWQVLTWEVLS